MSTSPLSRGARGAGVTVVGQIATIGIQFLSIVVLSRLLTPTDFGLVAMVVVFMGVGELLRDFGLPTAALQARSLSGQQASNVFWATAALSLLAALLLVVSTPWIVELYDEPRLASIIPVMAATLVISGLQAQYQVHLARAMRFTALAATAVVARFAGFIAGLTGAFLGWEYWALVAQLVVTAAATLLGNAIQARWLPSRPRRGHGSLDLFRSGGHFGAAQVLSFGADNVDTLVIGSMWGAGPLGIYNRSFQLFMAPISAVLSPLTRVVVPTINRASEHAAEIGYAHSSAAVLLRLQTAVSGLTIWILLVTAATADWLVPLLLGDQWLSTVPIIQILALGGAIRALSQVNYWSYIVNQQSKQLFYSNLVTKPFQILLIIGGVFFGIEGVAWAFVVGRAVTWPINLVWLYRTAGQPWGVFLWNGLRLLSAGGLAFLFVNWTMHLIDLTSPLATIILGTVFATSSYVAAIAATPGGLKEIRGAASIARAVARRR